MYGFMKLNTDPIIFVALMAHHASIIMSCNGTLLMDVGFSAPVARVHMPTEKQGFAVEQNKNGVCSKFMELLACVTQ
jgi:hypothetical protein